jgi:citronellol/citronellal dehydrogenase
MIANMGFRNKTIWITGASRGIGKAIALKLASEGANIVIAAKSVEEHPKLGGTIFSAAKEIEAIGGKALPVQVDIRNAEQIEFAVKQTIERFGGIDCLINNASALHLAGTEQMEVKRFDLIQSINVRGTFLVAKHCIPFLKKAENPHILTLSPPINLNPKWLGRHIAYTISKYSMTMMAMAWAEEFREVGIASNALWPKTIIDTVAIRNLLGGEKVANMSRKPEIMVDAAYVILSKQSRECTGKTFIDEDVLVTNGVSDFSKYSVVPGASLQIDLFI